MSDIRLKEALRLLEEQASIRARIQDLHKQTVGNSGMTDGYCAECEHLWPCPTFHIAAGWGFDSFHECEEEGFCQHVGVKW